MDRLLDVAVRYHLVLLAPLVAAWLLTPLVGRWLRLLGSQHGTELGKELEQAGTGSVRLLILLIGLQATVGWVPLQPTWQNALGGVLYVLSVVVGVRLAMRLSRVALRGYLERAAGASRERAQREYLPLASRVSTVALLTVGAILVAHHLGHDVSSLVAALGVGSLALGLAAQQTLGNMLAGFTLLVDQPFHPGDTIQLQSGELGRVLEIGIRSTRIRLDAHRLLIVPNGELANSRVINIAEEPRD